MAMDSNVLFMGNSWGGQTDCFCGAYRRQNLSIFHILNAADLVAKGSDPEWRTQQPRRQHYHRPHQR